jgi:uncharacterized Zn-finger protein
MKKTKHLEPYKDITFVDCNECGKRFNEGEIIDFIEIRSNDQGYDILEFICPYCGKQTISGRYG